MIMSKKKKIITTIIAIICVITLAGCSDKEPPPLGEIAADLSEDYLDGQWDVWLEIWKAGDRTDVYKSKMRFNLTSSLVDRNGSFGIYQGKKDELPERFSDLPGFQPGYACHGGEISIEESDIIYIWFHDYPEYKFHTLLTKNEDGKLTGYSSISFEEDGGIIASLHIIQTIKWGTTIIDVCPSCNKGIQAGWEERCGHCGVSFN